MLPYIPFIITIDIPFFIFYFLKNKIAGHISIRFKHNLRKYLIKEKF